MIRTIASNLLLKSNKIYQKMGTADTADVKEGGGGAGGGGAQKQTVRKTS